MLYGIKLEDCEQDKMQTEVNLLGLYMLRRYNRVKSFLNENTTRLENIVGIVEVKTAWSNSKNSKP